MKKILALLSSTLFFLPASSFASEVTHSWQCSGGTVHARIVKKMNASYTAYVENNSSEKAHIFVEGYSSIVCDDCSQRGRVEGGAKSLSVRPGKKSDVVIAATMLNLGRLDLKHFLYSCGKAQMKRVDGRIQDVSSKTEHRQPVSGKSPKNCIELKPAEGHLSIINNCDSQVQFIWCHEDESLTYLKKNYCGKDGKGRFFTQGYTVAKGKRYVISAYHPTTNVAWGACFGSKGAAHAFDGKGGYSCK